MKKKSIQENSAPILRVDESVSLEEQGIAPLIFGPTFVLALIDVLILEAKPSDGERGRQA